MVAMDGGDVFLFFLRNDVSKGTERDTDAHHSPPTAESGYLLLVTEKRERRQAGVSPQGTRRRPPEGAAPWEEEARRGQI